MKRNWRGLFKRAETCLEDLEDHPMEDLEDHLSELHLKDVETHELPRVGTENHSYEEPKWFIRLFKSGSSKI